MAKIKITRPKDRFPFSREINIFLDEKKIGTISQGENKKFDIPSGPHLLKVKYDWRGSKDFPITISDNENKRVIISVLNYENYLFIITGGILLLHYFLNYKFKIDFIVLLDIPFFLLLAYVMTFGRNYYLKLTEVHN